MQRNFRNISLITLAACVLAGCLNQSKIQGKYQEASDKCRSEAQSQPPTTPAPGVPAEDPNITLARQFSECMNKAGWHVAAPKPSTPLPPTAQNGAPAIFPNQPLSVDAAHTTAAMRGVAAQPTPANGATAAAPILGPGVQPAPAPATAPVNGLAPLNPAPSAPAPATYLPGRPTYGDDNSNGNSAGRQF